MSNKSDKETEENNITSIVDELGGAAIRVIDLIGKSVGKGTSSYNKFKSEGKDKELYSMISTQVNAVVTKVKERVGNKTEND